MEAIGNKPGSEIVPTLFKKPNSVPTTSTRIERDTDGLELRRWDEAPLFRKIAMGTWPDATSASVYGLLEIDMSKALPHMERLNREHGVKITPTHLMGRAVAHVMKVRPEINGMIRGSRIYLRKNVDLFFSVSVPGKGPDKVGKATLSGAPVRSAQDMSVVDIFRDLQQRAEDIRSDKDANFKSTFSILKKIPWWFSTTFLKIVSFLTYGLNWDLRMFGIPRDPFGSVILSNVGGMGVEVAWAPLMNYSRVPMLLTIGQVKEKPVAINGQVVVRPILKVGVTFDHRFIDGVQAAQMNQEFLKCFESPGEFLT